MILPIETGIEQLTRALSENEKKTNMRLMKQMAKIKQMLCLFRETLAPKRLKQEGGY